LNTSIESQSCTKSSLGVRGFTVILACTLFFGCGGGSGGGKEGSSTEGSMTMISTSPATKAEGVENCVPLSATFSGNIDPQTANESNILMQDSNGQKIEGTISVSGPTVTFNPKGRLALLREYHVTIKSGLEDDAGHCLGTDYQFSFTTGNGSWGSAEEFMEGAFLISYTSWPGNRKLFAVWGRSEDSASFWADMYGSSDGSWRIGDKLYAGTWDVCPSQVTVDENGNVLAAWVVQAELNNQPDGQIWSNYYMPGKGWGTAREISARGEWGCVSNLLVKMDKYGNAMAIWRQDAATGKGIWVNRFRAGTGWGEAIPVHSLSDSQEVNDISFCFDSQGNAIAIWIQRDSSSQSSGCPWSVWSVKYRAADDSWSTAFDISLTESEGSVVSPRMAMDKSGNALVVWGQDIEADEEKDNILAKRYSCAEGKWSDPVMVDDGTGIVCMPDIAFDSSGNAMVVWSQSKDRSSPAKIYANVFTSGGTWGKAGVISAEGTGDCWDAHAAYDPASGNAFAVWSQLESESSIWANQYLKGIGWGTAQVIGTDVRSEGAYTCSYRPVVIVDFYGSAAAIWIKNDFTNNTASLWINRFE
jgi:hypothetical protein